MASTDQDQPPKGSASQETSLEPVHEAVRQETAAPNKRSYRAWAFQIYVLVSLLAFAGLALFASVFQVNDFDVQMSRAIQGGLPAWAGVVLVWVSWFGFAAQSVVTTLSVVAAVYLIGLRWEAFVLAVAGVGSWAVNYVIKVAVRRPRPTEDLVKVFDMLSSYSFPSGHVMYYTVFFGFLAFLSFTLLKRPWLRALLALAFTSLVVLVGPSRVYLGEHWTSDVVAAYLLGFLILSAVIFLYRTGKRRYAPQQPVAPGTEEVSVPITGREKTNRGD